MIMIRITTQEGDKQVLVTIDGCMEDSDLEQVQACRMAAAGAVHLNLGGLEICTPAGIHEFQTWLTHGAKLKGSTPYQRMLLGVGRQSS